MHIPDGFLSPGVLAGSTAASSVAVGWAARRAQASAGETRAPMLGVMGAFVFAAQMINFPVGAGTTGHLLGAALLAIAAGPAAAVVVMTAVLVVQALVFQDGGLLALGANVFNMAVAGVAAAWLPYRLLGSGRCRWPGVFLAGFCSVAVSALLTLGALVMSGVPLPRQLAAVSLGLFGINGVIEGLVTSAAISAIARMNPSWAPQPARLNRRTAFVAVGAAVALVTGGILIACSGPDGLESLAGRLGIAGSARLLLATPFSDYQSAFLRHPWLSEATAGLVGLVLTFAVIQIALRIRTRKRGG